MERAAAERAYHHGDLRNEILKRAEEHLQAGGVDALSLRAIAREIGVSQTAPYRHFPDKNGLLAAIATEGFRELEAGIRREYQRSGRDPLVAFREAGVFYIEFAMAHPETFRLMFGNSVRHRGDFPELCQLAEKTFDAPRSFITDGIDAHIFDAGDPALMAGASWALVHGLATLFLDRGKAFGGEEERRVQMTMALEALARGFTHPRS